MADEEKQPTRLQVATMRPEDSGRGLARLPRRLMNVLGLDEGDVIEISGKRSTPARAVGPYAEDEDLDIIRLDGLQRANAEIGSGDFVTIRKAESKPAQRVVFAPAQKNLRLQGSAQALKRSFGLKPLTAGDVVATTGQQQIQHGDIPPELRQMLNAPAYALQEIRLTVVSTAPKGIVHIDADTEVELRAEYTEASDARRADVTYDDLGGIGTTIDQLREMVELPLRYPEIFERLGVDPPKGVLLHGPPGTGKTRLARAVANESDATFFHIAGPEIMGSAYGESEKRLRELFEGAAKAAPAIIFIDEIDSIAPKRSQVSGETEKRLVAQLLTLLDGLEPRQNLVVIAATNRPEALDEALRRPGRFDREIVVGVPDEGGRREILAIHTRGMPLGEGVDLIELARRTYGFVGADLAALTREAAIEAVRRIMPKINLEEGTIPPEVLDTLSVTRNDFEEALKRVQPSAMREVMVQAPTTTWDDIGGLDEARERLREGVELPLEGPRGVPAARNPPGQGLPALRPARHRQDPARQGRGARGGGEFHRHQDLGPALEMVWRERAADRPPVRPRPPGRADRHLHRRARQPGSGARRRNGRAAGDRAGGQHHPRRDGRARGIAVGGGDRRDQPAQPDRPGLAPPRPLRRADLRAGARPERAPPDPRHPHRQDAARQGRRPRQPRRPHRPLHRRRPRGSGPPRRPVRAARLAGRRAGDDGQFRAGPGRDPRLGHARDGEGL